MASNVFSVGTTNVRFSITNSNVDLTDSQDNFQPFSFFEYLKNTQQLNTPELFTQGYNDYLHVWYSTKNVEQTVQRDEIRQRYIDLLKDIAYNYTTSEEKRFLANLDYDDASDLSIAIPFYAQKLKEICLFYANKRESFKFRIEEVKIKGSTLSIEKAIFKSIIDYLSTDDAIAAATVTAVASDLQINITEYVDAYSSYFDLDPDATASDLQITNELRTKYLTSNTNAISANLFLNLRDTIANEVLNTPIYLKEIGQGLLINPRLLIQQALKQTACEQTLAQLLNTSVDALSSSYNLKRKLIEKYIGTDFYYLSTNSLTNFVSGELFKAANASGNLINKRFATTASVAEDDLISLQQLGLFFKPDKMGVVQFAAPSKRFYVDATKLEANKIYIFPDPQVYGNVDNFLYSNLDYPLLYVIDNSTHVKGLDQGAAQGKIKSSEYLQNFYAYFSEPVYINSSNINVSSFDANMLRVFNQGSFASYAQDVYGNEYGVIKKVDRYNEQQTDETNALGQCITIDGYAFYDDEVGYAFNYALTGINFDGSIRTGLTAQTVNRFPPAGGSFSTGYTAPSAGMFYLSGNKYTLYFREFSPFIDCNTTDNITCAIRDGGFFAPSDDETYPDVSSDSIAWSTNSRVYYSTLCDAGISATNSMTPGLTSATLTATIIAPALLSPLYESFDCRLFPNDACELNPDYNYAGLTISYLNDVNPECSSRLQAVQQLGDETLNDVNSMAGVLLVKNIATNQMYPLSSALSATFSKYNDVVKQELYNNRVQHINIYYDSIAVRTDNYLIFDKIKVANDGTFEKPGTANNYIAIGMDEYSSLSNTFYLEKTNEAWVCKTTLLNVASGGNEKIIYPQIYKYSVDDNKLQRKYPGLFVTNQTLSGLFANALSSINIIKAMDATLTYAAFNDKFNLTWTVVDLNGLSYLFSAWFNYKDDAIIFDADQIAVYKTSTQANTLNFYYNINELTNVDVASAANASFASQNNILYFN
jgi:hypothetical protein